MMATVTEGSIVSGPCLCCAPCKGCPPDHQPPNCIRITVSGLTGEWAVLNGVYDALRVQPTVWEWQSAPFTIDYGGGPATFVDKYSVTCLPTGGYRVGGYKVENPPVAGFATHNFRVDTTLLDGPSCDDINVSHSGLIDLIYIGTTYRVEYQTGTVTLTPCPGYGPTAPGGMAPDQTFPEPPEPMQAVAVQSVPLPRPVRCVSLLTRVEERAGCGGWNCLHICGSTRGDVSDHLGGVMTSAPGGDCQDCPGYISIANAG